jgi:hypothetical protein
VATTDLNRVPERTSRRRVAAGTVTNGRVDTRIELAAFDDRSEADRATFVAAAGPVRRRAASAGHEKTKDPLPTRPRGPHPQVAA